MSHLSVNKRTPLWIHEVLRCLRDDEWHDYEEILDKAGEMVPAGVAIQKAEWYRSYHHKRERKETPDRRDSQEAAIRTGRRLVVSKSIQQMKKAGRVELEYELGSGSKRRKPVKIRLTP